MEPKKAAIVPIYILVAIAVVIVIIVAIYLESSSGLVVAQGDNISVYYKLSLTNGTVIQSNFGQQPLNFTVGSGQVIAGFDNGVIGMGLNQNKTITIPANQAYGAINQSLIVIAPLSDFKNQTVHVGMSVAENSNGKQYQGIVIAVNSTSATVNFNSPLAGQTLVFTIRVIKIDT